MIPGFKILPGELPSLGFNLPAEQLALEHQTEGLVLTVVTLGDFVDPHGMSEFTLKTKDGGSLFSVPWPALMVVDDAVTKELLEYGEFDPADTENEYYFAWPAMLGQVFLHDTEHVFCGCDGEQIDRQLLWDCWPVTDEQTQDYWTARTHIDEAFLDGLLELMDLKTQLDEDWFHVDSDDEILCRARLQALWPLVFTEDGFLDVTLTELDYEAWCDPGSTMLEPWYRLLHSASMADLTYRSHHPLPLRWSA